LLSSAVRTFTDPDAYHAAIRGTHAKGIVTGRGDFRAESVVIRLARVSLQRCAETLPRIAYTMIDPKVIGAVFTTCPGPEPRVNGLEAAQTDIIVYGAGVDGYNRIPAACQWGSIALTHEDIAAAGRTIVGRELIAPPVTRRIRSPAPLMSRLLNLHAAAGHLAKTAPDILAKPEVGRAIDQALVEATVACLTSSDPVEERGAYRRHAQVMRRLEEVVRANPEDPLHVDDLCRAAGVSYRTLFGCCQEHLGMSPKRYLLLRRMHLARQALRAAQSDSTTVTEIATNYGFWELGRFSVVYRSLFGEPPSTTLHRTPEDPRPGETAGSLRQFA
jgi:AraC-like DNA-binding protein